MSQREDLFHERLNELNIDRVVPMTEEYESQDQCILDIIANTDAPYRIASLASEYVFNEKWQYDANPFHERGLTICRDFSDPTADMIVLYRGER